MNWIRNSLFIFVFLVATIAVMTAICFALYTIQTMAGTVAAAAATVLTLLLVSLIVGYVITKGFEQ